MSDRFNYDKAEADLYESGCPYSEEIYGYRSEEGINEFMRENGLDPQKYYKDKDNNDRTENNSSGCYITTACVEAKGLDDNCYELSILRNYRDTYLKNKPDGMKEISEYYRVAPQIVESINRREDATVIWDAVYKTIILPCISFIEKSKYEEAYELYKASTLDLKSKYL